MPTTKRVENSDEKQRKRPRGKPFEPGNAYAFKPGQSGNPGGRPKSRHLSKAGAEYLALPSAECPDITNAEHIVAVVGALAKAGDLEAVKWLGDRTEGKAQAHLRLDTTHHKSTDEEECEAANLLAEYRRRFGADRALALFMEDDPTLGALANDRVDAVKAEITRLVGEGWSEAEAKSILIEAVPLASQWLQ